MKIPLHIVRVERNYDEKFIFIKILNCHEKLKCHTDVLKIVQIYEFKETK